MQVTIHIDGALARRVTLCALTLAGVLALSQAHAGSVTIPNAFTGGTTISAAQMNANFNSVKAAVDDNDTRITALEAQVTALTNLLAGISRPDSSTFLFTGVNVQLVNGSSSTTTANGTGNLIVGYNPNSLSHARTGSHNVVVGDDHGYTGVAGLIVGYQHQASGEGACVLGGTLNEAGDGAAVLGGRMNRAVAGLQAFGPFGSVIVGGSSNTNSGFDSVILGGQGGTIDADPAFPGTDDGVTATMIGCHPAGGSQQGGSLMSENKGVYIGTNATGVGLGAWGNFVELGQNYRNYLGLGSTGPTTPAAGPIQIGGNQNNVNLEGTTIIVGTSSTQNVNVGNAAATTVVVGQGATNVVVGDNAANASLGNGATNVNVGNGSTGSVNVGGSANAVNVGISATSVNVGP